MDRDPRTGKTLTTRLINFDFHYTTPRERFHIDITPALNVNQGRLKRKCEGVDTRSSLPVQVSSPSPPIPKVEVIEVIPKVEPVERTLSDTIPEPEMDEAPSHKRPLQVLEAFDEVEELEEEDARLARKLELMRVRFYISTTFVSIAHYPQRRVQMYGELVELKVRQPVMTRLGILMQLSIGSDPEA